MKTTRFIHQRRLLYIIMTLGLFFLLMANTLTWVYQQRLKTVIVADTRLRLQSIARMASDLIDPQDLPLLISVNESDPRLINYQLLLYEIKDKNNLEDIYLLAPSLEVLVDLHANLETTPFKNPLDSTLLAQVFDGKIISSDIQTLGDHKFLTAVAPVMNSSNLITGLLVMEAPAEFFTALEQFNQGLILLGALNGLVIVITALLFVRSLKKVFNLQNQIKNQEHLVKLGEMAAAVAHELRNPLGIIKGANEIIQKKYGSKEDDIFSYIPAELDRLNNLIRNYLDFARLKPLSIQAVDIGEFIKRIKLGFIGLQQVSFHIQVDPRLTLIKTDPDILEQIFLNLLNNSIQAMNAAGEIRIHFLKQGNQLQITVDDTGPGIPAHMTETIFEPFFTTRDQGSGLGLAICKRLVEQLNGSIVARPVSGCGSSILIKIPIKYK